MDAVATPFVVALLMDINGLHRYPAPAPPFHPAGTPVALMVSASLAVQKFQVVITHQETFK